MRTYTTEDVLTAWDDMPKLKAPAQVLSSIQRRAKKKQLIIQWLSTAAVILLCMINLGVIASYRSATKTSETQTNKEKIINENFRFLDSHPF